VNVDGTALATNGVLDGHPAWPPSDSRIHDLDWK